MLTLVSREGPSSGEMTGVTFTREGEEKDLGNKPEETSYSIDERKIVLSNVGHVYKESRDLLLSPPITLETEPTLFRL